MKTEERKTMGGKPVFTVPGRILNMDSGFKHKLLCDGPTFSAGTSCQYSCSFCYVPAVMMKTVKGKFGSNKHEDIVIRRENSVRTLRGQLTTSKGKPKYLDPKDTRVIYASPLVDVASNMELVAETVELCKVILELTNWQIRLLSKSNLLPKIAQALSDADTGTYTCDFERHGYAARIIYGVSTGTLDNKLAQVFEEGCPLVSKRIESLHWLQDNGYRTFGMICPSLPQANYLMFASEMASAIRAERCEHVWAEVINLRGESFMRTLLALAEGGFHVEASRLEIVSNDPEAWEQYARATFIAHAAVGANKGKLRFLQYVNEKTRRFWECHVENGAVLL